jgi:hypothetical protein
MYLGLYGDYYGEDSEFAKDAGQEYLDKYEIKIDNIDNVALIQSKLIDKWLQIFHYYDMNQIIYISTHLWQHYHHKDIEVINYENDKTLDKINKVVKKQDNQLSLF